MPITPPTWSVAITKHERWEMLSPASLARTFVGYEWRCEAQVEGASLPVASQYYHFHLTRPDAPPLEWHGVPTLGNTDASGRLVRVRFQAVGDGCARFDEELTASNADAGYALEMQLVRADYATGRFVPVELAPT